MKKFIGGIVVGFLMVLGVLWVMENYHLLLANKNLPSPLEIRVTAYSPDPAQTMGDPFQMASGKRARVNDLYTLRYCAVSRDLKEKLGLRYGDKLVILVEMEVEVQDLMSERIQNTIDLFMRSKEQARGWGIKHGKILKIKRFF